MTIRVWAASSLRPDALGIGLFVFAAVLLIGLCIGLFLRKRPSVDELERRRREMIFRRGKIGDGEVTEIEGLYVSYSYSVAGVEYLASQDCSALRQQLPASIDAAIGPVCLKYDPRNPANSIVVCEGWSGLRQVGSGNTG